MFFLIAALAACATPAPRDGAERMDVSHYEACLKERRTHATAWEIIEAQCREEAAAAAKRALDPPSNPLSVISIPGGR